MSRGERARSPLTRLDPAATLFAALALSFFVACLASLRAALAALALAMLLLALARAPLSRILGRLALANVFILFMWLIVPWTAPGQVAWRWGMLAASWPGIELCLLVTVKANALMGIFMALVGTMSIPGLAAALAGLRCPEKLVWIFLLTGRQIHILARQWANLNEAARLRGFRACNSMHTYATMASMLALLLTTSHERALRMREAMLLRGFTGKLPALARPSPGWPDIFFGAALLLAAFLLACLEFGIGRVS